MSVVASVLVADGYSTPQSETRSTNVYQYNFEQYCRMLLTPNHRPIDVPLTRQHDRRRKVHSAILCDDVRQALRGLLYLGRIQPHIVAVWYCLMRHCHPSVKY